MCSLRGTLRDIFIRGGFFLATSHILEVVLLLYLLNMYLEELGRSLGSGSKLS